MTAEQAFNDQANRSAQEAKDTLVYYFERVLPKADPKEVCEIVDNIVDAAVAATRAALIKADRDSAKAVKS